MFKFPASDLNYPDDSIPYLYKNTYTDTVDGFLLIYQPLTIDSLVILNKEASLLFSFIDGRKTCSDIFQEVQKKRPEFSMKKAKCYFIEFFSAGIIHFDKNEKLIPIQEKKQHSLSVWVHTTNQCNLRCSYCFINKSAEKMSKEIGLYAIKKLFMSAVKHGIKSISLGFAGGEPLLEFPLVLTLIEKSRLYGKELNIETDFSITTNGVLLTGERAKILKEKNIKVKISLDGLEYYHNKTRKFSDGAGSFRFVERALNNLLKKGVNFTVHTVITSKNILGIPSFIKYLLSKQIHFTLGLYRETSYADNTLICSDVKIIDTLKKVYRLISQNPPQYDFLGSLLVLPAYFPKLQSCGVGKNYLTIRSDGKLASCPMTIDSPIGSIQEKDLIDTMVKGNFIKPRGLTVDGKTPCKDCLWKYICCGGCAFHTFQIKGRYDVSTPYCKVYKILIPEALRVVAKELIRHNGKFFSLLFSNPRYSQSLTTQSMFESPVFQRNIPLWNLEGRIGQSALMI